MESITRGKVETNMSMLTVLDQRLDECTTEYRSLKLAYIEKDWKPPASDIPVMVNAYIEDRLLGAVVVGGRDEGISVASVFRLGLGATSVILGVDAHMRAYTKEEYEREGPPAPGSFQRACHDEQACERREMTDTLMLIGLDEERDVTRSVAYALGPKAPHIEWNEVQDLDSRHTSGLVIDNLRNAWRRPTLKLDGDIAWVVRCAAIRSMLGCTIAALFAYSDDEWAGIARVDPGLGALFSSRGHA